MKQNLPRSYAGAKKLVLFFAFLLLSASQLFAHTVNVYSVNNTDGTTTFYAGTYHFEIQVPTGGIIIDGITYNFTGFQYNLPSNATLIHDCGYNGSVLYQTVNVAGIGPGAHSFDFTPTTVIESPYCTFPTGVITTGSGGCMPQPTISITNNSPVCPGGTINMAATGGVSYQWSGPNGFSSTSASVSIPNASSANAGNYLVIVTNSSGCSAAEQVNVTVTSPLASVYPGGVMTLCDGSSYTLGNAFGTSGSYQWKLNGNPIAGANNSFYDASAAGVYTFDLTAGGCTVSSDNSQTIVTSQTPAAIITAGSATTFCDGGSVELSANSGAGYTYEWMKNGYVVGYGASYTATSSGNYSVKVTNNGCNATSAVTTVVEHSLPGVTATASASTIDYGNSVTLTANTASTQTYYISYNDLVNMWYDCGSGSMYTYYTQAGFQWNDTGSGTVTNVEIQYSEGVNCISYYNYYSYYYGNYSTNIQTSLNGYAGPYVSATNDWCSCSSPYTEQIKTVNFSNPAGYVSGGMNSFGVNSGGPEYGFIPAASLNGYYAKVTVTYGSGGNDELSYVWTPGGHTGSSVTLSPTETTTYVVTASNSTGCSVTSSVTVNVTPPPVMFSLSSTNVSCPTGTDGSISVAATGGNNTFEYSINGGAYGSSNVFSGLAAGTYSVSVKQGTFVAAPQSITVSETPDNTAPSISCSGDVSVVAQPGDCTPSVSWSAPVASDNCSFSVSSSHNSGDRFPVGTTTVTYTATDISGNSTSCSFNVTVSATPLVMSVASPSYNGFNISCNGGSNGSATATVSGGCLPYSYVWSNGATSATASGLTAGTYNVTVTDANGSSVNQSITLTQPSALSVTGGIAPATAYSTAQANTIYLGYGPQSRTLSASVTGGVAAYSYNWSPASGLNSTTSASVTASPTASTNYMVTVTDANGCTASNSYALQVIDARCGTANNPKVIVCHNGNEICISANAVPAHLAHGCQVGSCGNARMAEAQEVHQAIFAAYPNPNNGNFTLEVEAATKGEVALELFDMNGRSVSKLFNGSMEAGEHRTFTVNQANLASGIYIVKMQTAGDVSVLQIAVQK